MMRDYTTIDNETLLTMLGWFSAVFGAFVNFKMRSNKGSDRTNELLAQAAPTRL